MDSPLPLRAWSTVINEAAWAVRKMRGAGKEKGLKRLRSEEVRAGCWF